MYMSPKMDAGDIISQEKIEILEDDNLDILYDKMAKLGKNLLIKTLPSIINKTNQRIEQDEKLVTFGFNIRKEDEKINFSNSAKDVYNLIRGLSSTPGAYCIMDNKRLKIYDAEVLYEKTNTIPGLISDVTKDYFIVNCSDYKLKIKNIQLEGKKKCSTKEYLNGIKKENLIGKVLV